MCHIQDMECSCLFLQWVQSGRYHEVCVICGLGMSCEIEDKDRAREQVEIIETCQASQIQVEHVLIQHSKTA